MLNAAILAPPQTSLWSQTSPEPPLATEPAKGDLRTAVAVVGGGYTGLSTALHLAERGVDVMLFEAAQVGAGASGLNGGQVIPGLKWNPDRLEAAFGDRGTVLTQIFGDAADLVFDLVARHDMRCQPSRKGWVLAAHAPLALASVRQRFDEWRRRGADVSLLSAQEMTALTSSTSYVGGMIDRRAGTLNPLAYARGLGRATMAAGAKVFETSPVRRLAPEKHGWRLEGAGFSVAADRVVIATDAYSGSLWPKLSRSLLVVNSIQIATEPVHGAASDILPSGVCLSETRKLAIYLRRDSGGRLVIGGRGPLGNQVPERLYADLKERLGQIFPQARPLDIAYRWQGRVGLTLDELPHLHEPAKGLTMALGYNGRGVAAATTMGRIVADRLTGGTLADAVPLTGLTGVPLRFLRQPLLAAAINYYRLRDRLGFGG